MRYALVIKMLSFVQLAAPVQLVALVSVSCVVTPTQRAFDAHATSLTLSLRVPCN